jgi:acyl carrier protein
MPATVTKPEVEEELFETILELSDCDPEDVTREATLEDLDLDSLDLVELGQVVMENWGIELVPEDFTDVKNVGDAFDVIAAKVT